LDIGANNSSQSNTCDPNKATQKWSWKDGYLRNGIGKGKCLKVKLAKGDSWSPEFSDCQGQSEMVFRGLN
jgi:hypothetical protein